MNDHGHFDAIAACDQYAREVIGEVVHRDCYQLEQLAARRHYDVLLDVGCNVGAVSWMARQLNLADSVEAIECNDFYADAYVQTMLGQGPVRLQRGYAAALSRRKLYGAPACEALVSVSDLLAAHQGQRVLLKMDIEGWEYPIFEELLERGQIAGNLDLVFEFHDPPSAYNQGVLHSEPGTLSATARRILISALEASLAGALDRPLRFLSHVHTGEYLLGVLASY